MTDMNNSTELRQIIDASYENRTWPKNKWIFINGVLLAALMNDLMTRCPDYVSVFYYIEICLAAVISIALVWHLWRLRPTCTSVTQVVIKSPSCSPRQTQPGWSNNNSLDPSIELSPSSISSVSDEDTSNKYNGLDSSNYLSVPPISTFSPPRYYDPLNDYFDRNYLRDDRLDTPNLEEWPPSTAAGIVAHYPHYSNFTAPNNDQYQLAMFDNKTVTSEEHGDIVAAHVWRWLHVEPTQLTEFNMNLRRWVHDTILTAVINEIDHVNGIMYRLGHEQVIGDVAPARLRAMVTAAPGTQLSAAIKELLPFLKDHPDQKYLVRRVKELARGGCLSAYSWDGGNSRWRPPHPTDAEIVMDLFEAYMSRMGCQTTDSLKIIRSSRLKSPHFSLRLEHDTLDVGPGRNNLFHTILLFIAAAARSEPPTISRIHLGSAGLNMLWIIKR